VARTVYVFLSFILSSDDDDDELAVCGCPVLLLRVAVLSVACTLRVHHLYSYTAQALEAFHVSNFSAAFFPIVAQRSGCGLLGFRDG
jgi:hypothetical protein